MNPAIAIDGLGKRYRISHAAGGNHTRTLRETLVHASGAPWRYLRGRGGATSEDFWALKDIDIHVQPGEVVGIIGHNGAGKSTLLKILSRITKPTTGRVAIRGRVGSLLEVGTGFHQELTGRENVYLNGGILGMRRREIDRNFDAIVEFSGVEAFLDTPVKRYSSGMQVRLAFAVAAHLDPEILIVDEVLAVGDATYQKRCIDRMTTLAHSGRTILFVSHNMDVIPQLCSRAFLLERGRVAASGSAGDIAARYLENQIAGALDDDLGGAARSGDGRARFTRLVMVDANGRRLPTHTRGDDLRLRLRIDAAQPVDDVGLSLLVTTLTGSRLITGWTREAGLRVDLHPGPQWFECRFRDVRLRPGHSVNLSLWMESNGVVDSVANARVVHITPGGAAHFSTDSNQGIVALDYEWSRCDDVASSPDGQEPSSHAA